ncbi:hypothetical protein B0H11DRAFT_1730412 [Mycena galericulata]|nr:hypothetical protein B0H11DRAFT_1730412 [Mycena galericulata]
MADDLLPTFGIGDETSYPVITWDSFRQNPSDVVPRVRYAKELVSLLHDYINSYDEHFRLSPHMRTVFESVIRENTAEDEPDAPWIDVINNVDAEPTPPWEFYYTNRIWLGDHIDPPDLTKLVGCDCRGKCDPDSTTCSCLKRQNEYLKGYCDPGFSYDNKGRLRTMGPPIFECNALCSCDDEDCRNRVVQHGRKCSVSIQKTTDKGWGVFATKRIPKGTFIGVYSGEFLRDEDSERRGLVYDKSGRTYLLDIDFYYLGGGGECQYVVDAYHAGNNNSCDPNCRVIPCYINEPDIKKPLFTLFSKRDIGVNEELCFSYQGYDPDDPDPDDPDGDEGKGKGTNTIKNKCRCGAARCTGLIFSRAPSFSV